MQGNISLWPMFLVFLSIAVLPFTSRSVHCHFQLSCMKSLFINCQFEAASN